MCRTAPLVVVVIARRTVKTGCGDFERMPIHRMHHIVVQAVLVRIVEFNSHVKSSYAASAPTPPKCKSARSQAVK
jgi:hypothetical protein